MTRGEPQKGSWDEAKGCTIDEPGTVLPRSVKGGRASGLLGRSPRWAVGNGGGSAWK